MFFGQGWPLLCLIALSYLQSDIVPVSPLGIFYFLVTLISHYGVITALLYFVFYMPLTMLFPNYYFSRIWSMTLIIMAGLMIFLDSTLFALYRFHFNRFILDLVFEGGASDVFKLKPSFYIISITLFLSAMAYIWYRGDKTWRAMQRRFSNPNSNWYLVLIGVFLLISHGLHAYGDAFGNRKITRHARVFPLYFPLTAKEILNDAGILPEKVAVQEEGLRDFGYPSEKMRCEGPENKNILMITVNNWIPTEINEWETPLLWHYVQHGQFFKNHLSAGTTPEIGIFSLFYALPGVYMRSAKQDQVAPVFLQELGKRGYEVGIFSDFELEREYVRSTVFLKAPIFNPTANINEDFRKWLELHLSRGEVRSFFSLLAINSPVGIDAKISEVVEGLHAKGLTQNTVIIITGTNAQSVPHELRVPLLVIWPGRSPEIFTSMTSHYDIVPTFMREEWDCKNDSNKYSDGHSLFDQQDLNWYVIGNQHEYEIIDFEKELIVNVSPVKGYEVKDFGLKDVPASRARKDLILSVLRNETRFTRQAKFGP